MHPLPPHRLVEVSVAVDIGVYVMIVLAVDVSLAHMCCGSLGPGPHVSLLQLRRQPEIGPSYFVCNLSLSEMSILHAPTQHIADTVRGLGGQSRHHVSVDANS